MKLTKSYLLKKLKNNTDILSILNNQQQQIHSLFQNDTTNYIKFIKEAQQITNNPLIQYQELLNQQLGMFPQKNILLSCLQIQSQFDINILKTMPNKVNQPLIHNILNQLIKHQLEYKEATTVLHYLHNKKLLKQLLTTQWVQSLITQSKSGFYHTNLKNLALLSRVYSDINIAYLYDIAKTIKFNEQADQFTYITLYQYLSILKNQEQLLNKLKSLIQIEQCNKQSLIQLLIGSSQSKDKEYMLLIYNQLNKQQLKDEDLCFVLMYTTNYAIYEKDKIEQLYSNGELIKLPFSNKQLGELCINLYKKYQLNILNQIDQSKIDESNIVNIYSIQQNDSWNLDDLIKKYILQNQIDYPGLMSLANYPQFQKTIADFMLNQDLENISTNIKELAAILLKVDPFIDNVHHILKFVLKCVEEGHFNAQGLGNILYLSSKKQNKQVIQFSTKVIKKILNDSDPIELINFLKALINYDSLTDDLQTKIKNEISKKVNTQNQDKVMRHIEKMPKNLQILYNQPRLI